MIPAPLSSLDLLYAARDNYAKTGSAWFAVVAPKTLPAMAEAFLASNWHLEDVSGLDTAEGAVSVYHFDHFDNPGRITVIAVAPHDAPVFPSIASVYYGAEWHERETRDFFGFIYEGNPNFIPLLLAEDMADVHPLLKDENARASVRTIFAAEGRGAEVLHKAEGFTLLDEPLPEPEPEPEPTPEAPVAARPEPGPAPETGAADATAQPAEARAEARAEAKIETGAETKAETKAESAPETGDAPLPEKDGAGAAAPKNAPASASPSRSSAAKASPKGKKASQSGKGGKK